MRILALCGLVGLLLACQSAGAKPETAPRRSVSYSTWLLEENLVTARLVLPAAEAGSLVGKSMPLLSSESLARYVLSKVSVTAGGARCEPADQGYDIGTINALSLGGNLSGFEIFFRCSNPGPISLHNALLFAEAPQHVDYARLERDGVHTAQLFTAGREDLSIPAAGPLPAAGMARFLLLGASHVWHSVERLAALLGFFMLARTRRLSTLLAALTFGHAASLALVVAGLNPDVALLDSGVGFVVACLAAVLVTESLRQQRAAIAASAVTRAACLLLGVILISGFVLALLHRPAAAWVLGGLAVVGGALIGAVLRGGGPSLPIVILPALAGLLDGLVLAGDYSRLGEWGALAPGNLLAFDAGALLLDALLLGAFAAAASFLTLRVSRFVPLAGDIATAVFAGFGSFWWLSRLY